MLSLDSSSWANLEHAYGSANDVPRLISRLLENPEDKEAWSEAWSSLCHQDTIYSASIAATPYFVEIAKRLPPKQRPDPLILVGSIATLEGKPPHVVYGDKQFAEACREGAKLLADAVSSGEILGEDLRCSLGALAGMLGDSKLANVIFRLDLLITCPACEAEIEPLESVLAF